MKVSLIFLIIFIPITIIAQKEFPIYIDKIPNSIPCEMKEFTGKNPTGKAFFANITNPTLTVYIPAKKDSLRTAILICPGGGYSRVVVEHEGIEVAKAFNEIGITAFVLKYRLPNDTCMTNKEIVPLQDAQQSIKLIRDHAKEYDINPNKVGVIGFSAGGHLASTLGTKFQTNYINNKENTNLRPDFMLLCYPVISMQKNICHEGSRDRLIGKTPPELLTQLFSTELQITSETPISFIIHSQDDKTVPVINSIRFYEALLNNKVKAEMHVYQSGGHGFGLYNENQPQHWFDLAKKWFLLNKLISNKLTN